MEEFYCPVTNIICKLLSTPSTPKKKTAAPFGSRSYCKYVYLLYTTIFRLYVAFLNSKLVANRLAGDLRSIKNAKVQITRLGEV